MKIIVVIPARYGSSRFPAKPLALVAGKSLLRRTWDIACAASGIDEVVVTTDDERIRAHAEAFGSTVIMTPSTCETGTDRVAKAVHGLLAETDAAINLQGDAVLTPPWVLEALARELQRADGPGFVTAAVRLDEARLAEFKEFKRANPTSGTTVVIDHAGNALYFSKAILPFFRKPGAAGVAPVHRHIGIYGHKVSVLEAFAALPPSSLEKAEGLEQLRALEHGMSIRVAVVDYRGRSHWSVDAPDDIAKVEAIIAREGELVAGARTGAP